MEIVRVVDREMKRERKVAGQEGGLLIMKSLLKVALINIAVLLVISSWTTMTEGQGLTLPFGKGKPNRGVELRLLSMEVPQVWNLSENVEYWATINFETDRKPEIRRACFNFSGDGQSCLDVQAKDVTYGSHPYFRVPIHVPANTKRIDCYAEYIRDEETQRTNTITYYVIILKKPEE